MNNVNNNNNASKQHDFERSWSYEAADKLRKEIFDCNVVTFVERIKPKKSADGKYICIYRQDNEGQQCSNVLQLSKLDPVTFNEEGLDEVKNIPFNLWKFISLWNRLLCDNHRELSYKQSKNYHIVDGYKFDDINVELLISELSLRLIYEYQFGLVADWRHQGRLLSLMNGVHLTHVNRNNEKLDVPKMKAFITQHSEHSRCVSYTPQFYLTELLHFNSLTCPLCTVIPEIEYYFDADW